MSARGAVAYSPPRKGAGAAGARRDLGWSGRHPPEATAARALAMSFTSIRRAGVAVLLVVLGCATASARGADAALVRVSPDLHEMDAWGEHARTAKIMLVLFQVAAMQRSGAAAS